jgi:hypothetical protein
MYYKKLNNTITNNYIKILKNKFINNNNIFQEINNILNDNIMIMGSTVLSGIINNIYINETRYIDIDICINLNDYGYLNLLDILNNNKNIKKKKIKHEYYINTILNHEIYLVYDMKNLNILELDLLYINIEPKIFLEKNTDFNILKNYYDGKNMYSLYYNNIITNYENINKIPNNENFYYRIKKYIKRGINISICHINIKTLYPNNDYPFLYIFRRHIANEIIKKYIHKKNISIKVKNQHKKKLNCIIS